MITHPHALSGTLTGQGHRLFQRVYYEDTDFSGLVYHARYLHFMERGRTDYLRLLGISQGVLHQGAPHATSEDGVAFVVRSMEIDFRAAARMDDMLQIDTWPRSPAGGAKLKLCQTVSCNDRLLVEASVTIAVINAAGRPRRLPDNIAKAFAARPA